jgi:hypothetical protein
VVTSGGSAGFDRLRPRTAERVRPPDVTPPDQEGRRALFSADQRPEGTFGAVTVDCSSCGVQSVVSAGQALRLAVPSLHLPFVRRDYWSWMRCPACQTRTWVRLDLKL